jgi:hypothetical protein
MLTAKGSHSLQPGTSRSENDVFLAQFLGSLLRTIGDRDLETAREIDTDGLRPQSKSAKPAVEPETKKAPKADEETGTGPKKTEDDRGAINALFDGACQLLKLATRSGTFSDINVTQSGVTVQVFQSTNPNRFVGTTSNRLSAGKDGEINFLPPRTEVMSGCEGEVGEREKEDRGKKLTQERESEDEEKGGEKTEKGTRKERRRAQQGKETRKTNEERASDGEDKPPPKPHNWEEREAAKRAAASKRVTEKSASRGKGERGDNENSAKESGGSTEATGKQPTKHTSTADKEASKSSPPATEGKARRSRGTRGKRKRAQSSSNPPPTATSSYSGKGTGRKEEKQGEEGVGSSKEKGSHSQDAESPPTTSNTAQQNTKRWGEWSGDSQMRGPMRAAVWEGMKGGIRLYVENLPFSCSGQDLYESLLSVDIVSFARIVQNDNGSRGFGFVTIRISDLPKLMDRCNGRTLEGRRITFTRARPSIRQLERETEVPPQAHGQHTIFKEGEHTFFAEISSINAPSEDDEADDDDAGDDSSEDEDVEGEEQEEETETVDATDQAQEEAEVEDEQDEQEDSDEVAEAEEREGNKKKNKDEHARPGKKKDPPPGEL